MKTLALMPAAMGTCTYRESTALAGWVGLRMSAFRRGQRDQAREQTYIPALEDPIALAVIVNLEALKEASRRVSFMRHTDLVPVA